MGISSHLEELNRLVKWISTCGRSKFQRVACNAIVVGVVYGIWEARNNGKWNLKVPTVQHIVHG